MNPDIKNGSLYFGGCNTVELAKKYGTPLYVLSEEKIMEQINQLKSCFLHRYPNTRVVYAAKAFCTKGMMELCAREKICVDVVSGGELHTAKSINFPGEYLEMNGNNKQRHELTDAISYGVGRIIVDNEQELSLIEDVCKELGRKVKVLYRVNPAVTSETHPYMTTGQQHSKFGMPLHDTIFTTIQKGLQSQYIDFLGFHFHIGSQLTSNKTHLQALEVTLNLVKSVQERFHIQISELNLGGGFSARYTDEVVQPFSHFIVPMMNQIEKTFKDLGTPRPAVVIEPGRSLVAEAGITLYTIGTIKEIPNIHTYVSVDGGMADNIRPALYQSKYHGIIANKADMPPNCKVTICGKCCESGDFLIQNIAIPTPKPQDIFAVFSTGAYNYSMASNYNKIPLPAVVLVNDGCDYLMVKRQSYDDICRNEQWPIKKPQLPA